MQERNLIYYEWRKLKDHENNYATHDLELATIVHVVKVWRNYVMGKKFELRTNHMSLKYLFEKINLNAKKAIWM